MEICEQELISATNLGSDSTFVVDDTTGVVVSNCGELSSDVGGVSAKFVFAVWITKDDALFVPLERDGPLPCCGDVFLRLSGSSCKFEFSNLVRFGSVSFNGEHSGENSVEVNELGQ